MSMLEHIKQAVYIVIKPEAIVGLFFSAFDHQGILIISHGVVSTDKPAEQLINLVYNGIFAPHASKTAMIACDIVTSIKQEDNTDALLAYNPEQYGLIMATLDNSKSGVILPHTAGVSDMKSAILYIKSKYTISGNVTMSVFTTQRIIIK